MAERRPTSTSTSGPWILDNASLFVIVLLAVHVLALVFWMYKLATQKQPPRRKIH